jgi:heme-degrading monooxygenase HmoA
MAVAVLVEVEGAGLETYEAVNAAMGGLAENPPEGLLVHTVAGRESGGYFVFNVWESTAAWETFRDGRRSAAVREVMPEGIAPPKVSVWELHAFASF